MVRAPCCERMGLKRGPWSPEEDEVLVSHINKCGHRNWSALPKQAGLLRCGKSCRLRWTNYLRPDIKRGNFTREEEDAIIWLHSMLGNRWSTIAARLPGRTDNEIKNVWHTHLKKRLKRSDFNSETRPKTRKKNASSLVGEIKYEKIDFHGGSEFYFGSTSPQPSSSATDASVISWETHSIFEAQQVEIPSIERRFSIESSESSRVEASYHAFRLAEESKDELSSMAENWIESDYHKSPNIDDCMDFWSNLLLRADELP